MKTLSCLGLLIVLFISSYIRVSGQSFELMPGTERIFVDAQWLKTFDQAKHISFFSRSRATVDYDQNTDLFTGGYLNYTSKVGLGGTILGRISSLSSGFDVGPHFFKRKSNWMLYALASIELSNELGYSWFSIFRFTPSFNDNWKLYSSLELFSNFNDAGHVASVQRIRLGLDYKSYQFGLAINLSGIGRNYQIKDENPGIFLRKVF